MNDGVVRAAGAAGTSGAEPSPLARRRLTLGGVAGLVGAAAYDSFLLARPLGSSLDPVNAYVSELGVRTQPASALFRGSDELAGLLIVVLALVLRDGLPRHWHGEAGRAALAIGGVASAPRRRRSDPPTAPGAYRVQRNRRRRGLGQHAAARQPAPGDPAVAPPWRARSPGGVGGDRSGAAGAAALAGQPLGRAGRACPGAVDFGVVRRAGPAGAPHGLAPAGRQPGQPALLMSLGRCRPCRWLQGAPTSGGASTWLGCSPRSHPTGGIVQPRRRAVTAGDVSWRPGKRCKWTTSISSSSWCSRSCSEPVDCPRWAATSARGSASSGTASPRAHTTMPEPRGRRRQKTTTAPQTEEPCSPLWRTSVSRRT